LRGGEINENLPLRRPTVEVERRAVGSIRKRSPIRNCSHRGGRPLVWVIAGTNSSAENGTDWMRNL
jgi:hypothetical protein